MQVGIVKNQKNGNARLGGKSEYEFKCDSCSGRLRVLSQVNQLWVFGCHECPRPTYLAVRIHPSTERVDREKLKNQKAFATNYIHFASESSLLESQADVYSSDDDFGPEDDDFSHEMELLREYQKRTGDKMTGLSNNEGEAYEKSRLKGVTPDAERFYHIVNRNSEQCIRYQKNGPVLWYRKDGVPKVPPCEKCGTKRVFEYQLMPNALNVLLKNDDRDLKTILTSGIDFVTIAVFACPNQCRLEGKDEFKEFCIVQKE